MPFFNRRWQYQKEARVDPVPPAIEITTLSSPVIFKRDFIYSSLALAVAVTAPVVTAIENTTLTSQVVFTSRFQYQCHTEPAFVPAPTVSLDSWYAPWRGPVKVKVDPRWRRALAGAPSLAAPPFPVAAEVDVDSFYRRWSDPPKVKRGLSIGQQQTLAAPVFTPEVVTVDKWVYPWTEPVRQKAGLKTHLQQAFIAPVLDDETQIIQDFESRWHYPWSEPVRFRRLPVSEYPSFTTDAKTPETINVDKWTYAWSEPVQFRSFPTCEQQAYAAPVFTPEFITTDKWTYPWSEPVRQKIGPRASLQQAAIGPVLDDETQIIDQFESRWHYAWSEPVRIKRQVPVGEQSFLIQGPVQTPEFITVDKWIYAWSEPVRQKIGLKTHLQQAFIAPVLDDETQIIQDFESRWHLPWSEPVRVKRPLLTAQQQALIYQSAFFETLNIDKWGFAWSEPVRQKIGLKTHLQQAFIGLTLEPETQIIQGYESRWHFAWSEPVRVKRQVPVGEQSFLIQGPPQTPEFITVDKWIYPWTDPVRQKIGIATRLQQAFIAPVLADEQITGSIEARWHQPWSEPLRFRRFPTAEQQAVAAPTTSVFETINVDKWFEPFTDPVRQKIGLRSALQQAFIAPVLNPETQIIQGYESRWHQPWSEPNRRKPSAASQPSSFWGLFTPSAVVFDWFAPWQQPVRKPAELKVQLQQALFVPSVQATFVAESISSPVIFLKEFQYQGLAQTFFVAPEVISVDKWFVAWHQPARYLVELKVQLQQALFVPAVQTPVIAESLSSPIIFSREFQYQGSTQPEFVTPETIYIDKWGYAWSEPVRPKRLLTGDYPDFFTPVVTRPIIAEAISSPVIFLKEFQYQSFTETASYPTLLRTIPWFAPLNEPVRLKLGLWASLQQYYVIDMIPPPVTGVNVALLATEVNSDSASFGITAYNAVPVVTRVPRVVVSIKEVPAVRTADVSTEEIPAIDNASVSIKET